MKKKRCQRIGVVFVSLFMVLCFSSLTMAAEAKTKDAKDKRNSSNSLSKRTKSKIGWCCIEGKVRRTSRKKCRAIGGNFEKTESRARSRCTASRPPIGEGGHSENYDPGVDLVVSKVVMNRGTFGNNPEPQIQIIPYVKNMWEGKTKKRVKILFDGLGRAVWLHGGLDGHEEKGAGAIYLSDDGTGEFPLRFHVEVDNNNTIQENNEHNNRCENVQFAPDATTRTHRCRIRGPHGQLN